MFRGFVGVIILLMVGVILLVVVIGVLVYVWYQGNLILFDFNKMLVFFGNQAGLMVDCMLVLFRVGQVVGLMFNQISELFSVLVKAGVSGEVQIVFISQSVVCFFFVFGVEVDKVVEVFGKLIIDLMLGLMVMVCQFYNVLVEQIVYVVQLQCFGDEVGVLQVVNEVVMKGFDDQICCLKENMGMLEIWVDRIVWVFKFMWDVVLDIGCFDIVQEMLIKVEVVYKKVDDIWNLCKDDYFVNDEVWVCYWDDCEKVCFVFEVV